MRIENRESISKGCPIHTKTLSSGNEMQCVTVTFDTQTMPPICAELSRVDFEAHFVDSTSTS